jgi:hypothetical protein
LWTPPPAPGNGHCWGHCGTREKSEGTPAQSSPTTRSRYMPPTPGIRWKVLPFPHSSRLQACHGGVDWVKREENFSLQRCNFCRDRELLGVKRQFGGRGLEAVGSPKFFRARHAPLVGAVTVHTVDALITYTKQYVWLIIIIKYLEQLELAIFCHCILFWSMFLWRVY